MNDNELYLSHYYLPSNKPPRTIINENYRPDPPSNISFSSNRFELHSRCIKCPKFGECSDYYNDNISTTRNELDKIIYENSYNYLLDNIIKVEYYKNTTIITWRNGKVTSSKLFNTSKYYDRKKGFAIAVLKYVVGVGSHKFNDILDKYCSKKGYNYENDKDK
jgi:hypothetical protein